MNSAERRAANDSQLGVFFAGYEYTWRLTKLLLLKALLEDRSKLNPILKAYYGTDDFSNDAYVYGPVTNGLIFSGLSELLMYCEDLFALLKFIREPEYFVRSIVSYSAGTVTNLAKKLETAQPALILKAFMIPERQHLEAILAAGPTPSEQAASILSLHDQDSETICAFVKDVTSAFKRFEFYYNQYKHGLTVAIKPFGGPLNSTAIATRKAHLRGLPVSYDNDTIGAAFGKGKLSGGAVVIPGLCKETQPHLKELMEERNLLRYHMRDEISIDELIGLGNRVAVLLVCLIKNRWDFITPMTPGSNTFWLPFDRDAKNLSTRQICITPSGKPRSLADYPVKF